MKCVILAAGYATRLYPLTENFPKPLLKIGSKTILDRLLDDLDADGRVESVLIVSNHRYAEAFNDWALTRKNVPKILDDGTERNETRLGAVKDLQLAAEALPASDLLVAAGDNLLDFSLSGFLDYALEKQAPCVMCYPESDPEKRKRTGIICRDADGRIFSFEEKPALPRGTLAVPAFYYYRAEDLRRIPEALADGCGADAPGSFAAWLSRQTALYAWSMPGARHDVGSMDSYREAIRLFGE